jgi:hypothetical protein
MRGLWKAVDVVITAVMLMLCLLAGFVVGSWVVGWLRG